MNWDRIKAITSLMIPYGAFVGYMYQIGYWKKFNINPAQFVGIQELVIQSIIPVVGLMFLAVLVSIFSHYFAAKLENDPGNGKVRSNKFGYMIPVSKYQWVLYFLLIATYVVGILFGSVSVLLFLGLNFVFLIITIIYIKQLSKIYRKYPLAPIFCQSLIVLPIFSYGLGEEIAEKIIRKFSHDTSGYCELYLTNGNVKRGCYIGSLGDKIFLMTETQLSIEMYPDGEIKLIRFKFEKDSK